MNENLEALDDYLSPEFMNHVTGQTDIAAYRSVVEWARRLQGEGGVNVIDDLLAEEDRVVMFITVNGRLSSKVQVFGMTFPPNGPTFSNKHVHMFCVRDGKFTEHWATRCCFSLGPAWSVLVARRDRAALPDNSRPRNSGELPPKRPLRTERA